MRGRGGSLPPLVPPHHDAMISAGRGRGRGGGKGRLGAGGRVEQGRAGQGCGQQAITHTHPQG